MRITVKEIESNTRFSVSEFDEKYRNILQMCFYNEENGVYYKDYPSDYRYINEVKQNFETFGEEMFNQLGYFSEIPWYDALKAFCQRVEGHDIDWWLTGSCASCIRGIKMNPHDVDIMLNSKDVYKIEDLFSENLIEPLVNTGGWLTKDFGVIFLKARIDIATDPVEELDYPEPVDCGPAAKKRLENITWEGHNIKVPPIEFQLNANKRRGRLERVNLIEDYMRKNM